MKLRAWIAGALLASGSAALSQKADAPARPKEDRAPLECRVMESRAGDVSLPVRVCRTPGGVWHKVAATMGGESGGRFEGRITYSGHFSGRTSRVQRSNVNMNLGGFRLNLRDIETGASDIRPVEGVVTARLAATGEYTEIAFDLQGSGFNASYLLRGPRNGADCSLSDAGGNAHFEGRCESNGLRGTFRSENRSGWRVEFVVEAAMSSRQDNVQLALNSAAEQQRQQEAAREKAERVQQYMGKLLTRAQGGDVEAMGTLGDLYSDSSSGEYSLAKSAYWYGMASRSGDMRATFNLGIAYRKGEGVEKNDTIAIDIFRKCARIASKYQSACMKNIGFAYAYGEGVPKSMNTAIVWFRSCARLGDAKCDELASLATRAGSD